MNTSVGLFKTTFSPPIQCARYLRLFVRFNLLLSIKLNSSFIKYMMPKVPRVSQPPKLRSSNQPTQLSNFSQTDRNSPPRSCNWDSCTSSPPSRSPPAEQKEYTEISPMKIPLSATLHFIFLKAFRLQVRAKCLLCLLGGEKN